MSVHIDPNFTEELWETYTNEKICEMLDICSTTLQLWRKMKGYKPKRECKIIPSSFTYEKYINKTLKELAIEYDTYEQKIYNWAKEKQYNKYNIDSDIILSEMTKEEYLNSSGKNLSEKYKLPRSTINRYGLNKGWKKKMGRPRKNKGDER